MRMPNGNTEERWGEGQAKICASQEPEDPF
jgi:hypothetical protein